MEIKGAFTALITPFNDDGGVDYGTLRKLIEIQVENNVGLVVLGTTGETPNLNSEEKKTIINIALEISNGKVPVIVGTGTNSTHKTLEETRIAKEMGADAVLIVTPYYNKPTDEGIFQHFKKISDNVDISVIVYNIQSRTGKNISTKLLKRLSELKNIIGVKEASGDIHQIMEVIYTLPKDFIVLSGDDILTFPLIMLGGKGVISVVSNLYPKEISDLVSYSINNNFEKAREIHYKLLPFFKAAFIETNPIPIKYAMSLKGLIKENYRLPLCKMADENKELIKKVLLNE